MSGHRDLAAAERRGLEGFLLALAKELSPETAFLIGTSLRLVVGPVTNPVVCAGLKGHRGKLARQLLDGVFLDVEPIDTPQGVAISAFARGATGAEALCTALVSNGKELVELWLFEDLSSRISREVVRSVVHEGQGQVGALYTIGGYDAELGQFRGEAAAQAVLEKKLTLLSTGPELGEEVYSDPATGECWEITLEEATYHDWPPILRRRRR